MVMVFVLRWRIWSISSSQNLAPSSSSSMMAPYAPRRNRSSISFLESCCCTAWEVRKRMDGHGSRNFIQQIKMNNLGQIILFLNYIIKWTWVPHTTYARNKHTHVVLLKSYHQTPCVSPQQLFIMQIYSARTDVGNLLIAQPQVILRGHQLQIYCTSTYILHILLTHSLTKRIVSNRIGYTSSGNFRSELQVFGFVNSFFFFFAWQFFLLSAICYSFPLMSFTTDYIGNCWLLLLLETNSWKKSFVFHFYDFAHSTTMTRGII